MADSAALRRSTRVTKSKAKDSDRALTSSPAPRKSPKIIEKHPLKSPQNSKNPRKLPKGNSSMQAGSPEPAVASSLEMPQTRGRDSRKRKAQTRSEIEEQHAAVSQMHPDASPASLSAASTAARVSTKHKSSASRNTRSAPSTQASAADSIAAPAAATVVPSNPVSQASDIGELLPADLIRGGLALLEKHVANEAAARKAARRKERLERKRMHKAAAKLAAAQAALPAPGKTQVVRIPAGEPIVLPTAKPRFNPAEVFLMKRLQVPKRTPLQGRK